MTIQPDFYIGVAVAVFVVMLFRSNEEEENE